MTPSEFDAEFYKLRNKGISPSDAFWQVNNDYEDKYGKLRYSDYNSYRISKWNRMRNTY